MGGQKSLRSYWRNYFEQTDGLVWVVDSADRRRLEDTAAELASLLKEERLAGATLLVLANKQDMPGALPPGEIEQVRVCMCVCVLGGGSGEICWPAGNPVAGRVRRWGWRHRGGGHLVLSDMMGAGWVHGVAIGATGPAAHPPAPRTLPRP